MPFMRLLYDSELASSARCLVCANQHRPLVDLGVDGVPTVGAPMPGRRYLCMPCALSVGRTAGMLDPDLYETMKDKVASLQEQLHQARVLGSVSREVEALLEEKLRQVSFAPPPSSEREDGAEPAVKTVLRKRGRPRGSSRNRTRT